MKEWLAPLQDALARGEAAALVHVADLKGSGPREIGAQMLVTETGGFGTIGGGELEHTAIRRARALLDTGGAAVVRLSLGPELGQCCGGAVTLAFEPFAPADRAWVAKLVAACSEPEPVFRSVRFGAGGLWREWKRGGEGPKTALRNTALWNAAADGETALEIREHMNAPRPPVWLFGAGHVGRACAAALAPLGFDLVWIDGRTGQFPDPPPPGVRMLALAMPELIVDEAPSGAMFMVMTHSHPLDEAICDAVLRRNDFAYLGLIGSATKRARFVSRLRRAGLATAQLDRLACPIGLPGIASKEPAVIAASVAADLLLRRQSAASVRQSEPLSDGR